jgi:hypothetical protein
MQSGSSGLLESVAAGLFCIVLLAAVYRKDVDRSVCQTECIAMAHQPRAVPPQPTDARIEAEIKDMLLHD